jgi:SAM-dependent methyltransferase
LNLETMTPQERQEVVDRFYWYHSIKFGEGVASRGTVDHDAAFPRYGFPSVAGESVLDVGASDGYFAFKLEELGATRVVAVDINRWADTSGMDTPVRTRARRQQKWMPFAGQEKEYKAREALARELGLETPNPFHLAHLLRRSKVESRYLSVYDLAQLNTQFDLVFAGTITTHLQDLPAAFEAMRAVTRRQAVVACADLLDYRPRTGWRWMAYQAIRALSAGAGLQDEFPMARERPVALYSANEGGAIWRPSVACITEMLLSAGFRDVNVFSRFTLDNLRHQTKMKHVVFHAFV